MAVEYEQGEDFHHFPKLVFVITGKGPMKQFYEEEMSKLSLTKARIETRWLEAADYPKILACADLGVSLHYSSSGFDLPMKIVDMFGSALPVCSIDYPTLRELVDPNHNGLIFSSSQELATQLFVSFDCRLFLLETNLDLNLFFLFSESI